MGEPINEATNALRMRFQTPTSQPVRSNPQIDTRLPATMRDKYIPPVPWDEPGRAAIRIPRRASFFDPIPKLKLKVEMSDEANKRYDPLNLDHKPRAKLVLEWHFYNP